MQGVTFRGVLEGVTFSCELEDVTVAGCDFPWCEAGCDVLQGVTFPAMHAMWAQWAPVFERSKLASFTYSGTSLFGVWVCCWCCHWRRWCCFFSVLLLLLLWSWWCYVACLHVHARALVCMCAFMRVLVWGSGLVIKQWLIAVAACLGGYAGERVWGTGGR